MLAPLTTKIRLVFLQISVPSFQFKAFTLLIADRYFVGFLTTRGILCSKMIACLPQAYLSTIYKCFSLCSLSNNFNNSVGRNWWIKLKWYWFRCFKISISILTLDKHSISQFLCYIHLLHHTHYVKIHIASRCSGVRKVLIQKNVHGKLDRACLIQIS